MKEKFQRVVHRPGNLEQSSLANGDDHGVALFTLG